MVDFEIEIQPEMWIEGIASTPVENSAVITLVGATVSEAARFAQWLRTTLVPAVSPVCFSSEPALDSGDTTQWHISAGGPVLLVVVRRMVFRDDSADLVEVWRTRR
ncbi:hypothetical protein [Streptomyces hundungensis]|uniref:hypothetical protein n=1 Tax=Streptomyces hundungensis TaxID=1077946 RepID=UPI003407EAB2